MDLDEIQLLSVVLGGVLTITATILVEWFRDIRKARSIQSAIISEVGAITEFLEQQNISKRFMSPKILNYIETVEILPANYSSIYLENSKDIGLIDKKLSVKLVRFYQLVEAIRFDLSDPSFQADGGERNLNAIKRYNKISKLSQEIIDFSRKKNCKPLNFKADKNMFSVKKEDISD